MWLLRGCAWLPGVCMVAGGHVWLPGGVHGCGGRGCMVVGGVSGYRGACVVAGSVHGCWGVYVVGGQCVRYDEIRSMNGRYASYWNAFLFEIFSFYNFP